MKRVNTFERIIIQNEQAPTNDMMGEWKEIRKRDEVYVLSDWWIFLRKRFNLAHRSVGVGVTCLTGTMENQLSWENFYDMRYLRDIELPTDSESWVN